MKQNRGIDLLAEYVFLSKYSQKKEDGYLESWNDTLDRIYAMHVEKLKSLGLYNDATECMIKRAYKLESDKKILSSQRGRQFASPVHTSGILKHEAKMYNCCSTFIDRIDVFGEIMYLLLCGCGVGYSLHKEYIDKLPIVEPQSAQLHFEYTIADSVEGWADSIKELISALFAGGDVEFNYDNIRPAGSLIDGKFVAPGPRPLSKAHSKIRKIMKQAGGRKLTSIELHDIICFIAESVVSGGVRRSAMIALFDKDDELMLKAKTGEWWTNNPQRAMANNSILCTLDDPMGYAELKEKLQVIRQFGEPGFVNVPDYKYVVNPCGEIVMTPKLGNETGFAFCNLVEINAERINSVEEFKDACEVASFVATVQALYTDFKYLSDASRKIAERDRAIGVSITGICANPLLHGEVLSMGAGVVANTNKLWADTFSINPSRTCTTVKPSGNASSILGLYCSGIHPAHADKYLRRVRIKTFSPEYIALKDTPLVKLLRDDEAVITFPIEIDNKNVLTKDQVCAIEHLKFISMVKHYWINKGATKKHAVSNNISATVEVKDDEWNEVAAVLFTNNYLFTGISLLPKLGDQIYDNAPFQRLSTPDTIKEWDDIVEYLYSHDVDFNEIMSNRDNIYSGDLAAIGCSGGACELR
jgi:ribonucleoside-triphosphate reductase (thioredoxin)